MSNAASEFEKLIPSDKVLSREWIASLTARGEPEVYSGGDLQWIGMPIGGICAGQFYLGGDGKLWNWDIFNQPIFTGGEHYANPMRPSSPLDQGFAIRVTHNGETTIRTLDREGFADITFRGEYPIGYVTYKDAGIPVEVSLEAFSAFIPLNTEDSSLPATILRYTVKNTGGARIDVELVGWLQNGVCLYSAQCGAGLRRNKIHKLHGGSFLECSVEPITYKEEHLPVVFEDFESGAYTNWKVEGDAFGAQPAAGAPDNVQQLSGHLGSRLANSWTGSDAPQGKLISREFVVDRPFISFLIGGGNHPGETCINLIVNDQIVRTSTGLNSDAMRWDNWNVTDLQGKDARIEIVDHHSGGWGHIEIDQIEFRDTPRMAEPIEKAADFGTMGIALLHGDGKEITQASVTEDKRPDAVFAANGAGSDATAPFGHDLYGALGRSISLDPGREAHVVFAITWRFPNLAAAIVGLKSGVVGRYYATRFDSAFAVAEHIARHLDRLTDETRRWHDTWYDSTLPHWFLNRTLTNAAILATSTCYRFASGRFYGYEGVGCCLGTCTHVWHYAHAVARLFPDLERTAREMVDFRIAFDAKTGMIDHRGECGFGPAIDGQAGTILRAYREHLMSSDNAFLTRNWPAIKKGIEFLIAQDVDDDGIIQGAQHNTLDAAWYGPISWISSLYLASLRAGEEMAKIVGDGMFADRTHAIFETGWRKIVELLWNGEYFIQKPDPNHPEAVRSGDGCEIDQVFGQSWAFQVGLGRIIDERHARKALQALWRYNFAPDVGPYRAVYQSGRWFAMPGEAGLLMCTFPRGGGESAGGTENSGLAGYFNECMTGFEYQAAGHMIWEGMVTEGLAVARAIHDRYHASKRNPWNEIECGDHYARSMASYGVYIAACGFEYDGPKGHLAFSPRIRPDDFRAAFTSAMGWGTIGQVRSDRVQTNTIDVRWGELHLRRIAIDIPEGSQRIEVTAMLNDMPIEISALLERSRVSIDLSDERVIKSGRQLRVKTTWHEGA